MVIQWILNFAKTMAPLNQPSVSDVAKLQATGVVAIAITEAVLPKDAYSKLTTCELGDVAELFSYHCMPLDRILECQAVVWKRFSTGKCK